MTKSQEVELAEIKKDIEYIKRTVQRIEHRQEIDFVTREEFEPIKKIVYGMVTLVLTSVFVGLLTLVVRG